MVMAFLLFTVFSLIPSACRPKDALRCLAVTIIALIVIGAFCGLGIFLPFLFLFLYPFFFSFFYHWQTAAGCIVFTAAFHLIASQYTPDVLMWVLISAPFMYIYTYIPAVCIVLIVRAIRKRRREKATADSQ